MGYFIRIWTNNQYKQQVQRLEKRYQVAQQERLAAMKAWHTYDQP